MMALRPVGTIIGYALREGLRRRIFAVVLALTAAFLILYGVAVHFAFRDVASFAGGQSDLIDPISFTGSTIFGLAMFSILFLGAVLAVFLTLGVVRGDAESGLLQPLVVRPIGRSVMLLSRFAGAGLLSGAYVLTVYFACLGITTAAGDWSPDHVVGPALGLAFAVVIIAALSILVSVFLSATAQGIAVFMVFGAGLVTGLLAQIGQAINSGTLHSIGQVGSWVLPFEGLYAGGLHALVSDTSGLTGFVLQLGPFGGAEAAGPPLIFLSVVYAAAVLAIACWGFARRDL